MSTSLLQSAKSLAHEAHANQTDKLGRPYIFHVEDVAQRVSHLGTEYETAAWLHDIVEDTPITIDDLIARFGGDIAAAVDAITRNTGEGYFADYIPRVASHHIAKAVKLADATHNKEKLSELEATDPKTAKSLLKRYERVIAILDDKSLSA